MVTLSPKQETAAQYVAEDKLTDEAIVKRLRVARRTFYYWKTTPEFIARVAELRDAYRKAVRERGIAVIENRVDALNDRWKGLKQTVAERAEELAGETPGGGTGLLTRKPAFVKVLELKTDRETDIEETDDRDYTPTKQTRLVYEYAVDTGLLAEMRNLEKQAAQELGQWVDRHDVETRDTSSRESLKRKLVSVAERGGANPVPGVSDAG
jgi:hypothetical protein